MTPEELVRNQLIEGALLEAMYKLPDLIREKLDASTTAVTVSDSETKDDDLIYSNEAFEHLCGYKSDEILGRNCRFLQGVDTDQTEVAKIRTAIEDRVTISACLRNYKSDGAPFDNLLIIHPIVGLRRRRLVLGCQYNIDPDIRQGEIDRQLAEVDSISGSLQMTLNRLRTVENTSRTQRARAIATQVTSYFLRQSVRGN